MPRSFSPNNPSKGKSKTEQVEDFLARSRQGRSKKEESYREQSLRIHPWVCARCGREFTHRNVHELTVHHKDHDHENNPPDGSNWENLCIYCHENEHRRHLDHLEGANISLGDEKTESFKHNPFAKLKDLMASKED